MKQSTIAASEFKARCFRLLDEVAEQGATSIVTKRGRAIAKVAPISTARKSTRGSWKDIVKVTGDIVHFSVAGDWEAAR